MKETVQNALLKKADQIGRAAQILADKTRDWQVIKQYLNGRLEDMGLTDEQQEKLNRYQFIYNQLVSGKYTEQEVIQQVTRIYKVGLPQAYEDKNATQEIFSCVLNINKRFEFKMLLEICKDMHRKCAEIGDNKAAKGYATVIKDILKELEEPEDDGAADLWEGISIEALYDPTLLGAPDVNMRDVLKVINEKRKVPINFELFAQDIDHEEVKNGS